MRRRNREPSVKDLPRFRVAPKATEGLAKTQESQDRSGVEALCTSIVRDRRLGVALEVRFSEENIDTLRRDPFRRAVAFDRSLAVSFHLEPIVAQCHVPLGSVPRERY